MAKFNPKIDFSGLTAQFSGLQGRHPGLWPALPRVALLVGLAAVVLGVAYMSYWRGQLEELDKQVRDEQQLKQEFTFKMKQAINLDVLRNQKEQVSQYVSQLEKQLPSKAEMDALLSDINQAGLGRSLYFDLFRPGQVSVKEYYAELPIALRVTGRYHDVGSFASDIANLSRIVTLNNMSVTPGRDGTLVLDATAKTFRYLDPDEVMAQRKAAAPPPKK